MPYPDQILPKKNYKEQMNTDSLSVAYKNNILIRRASVKEFADPDNIKLREICHPTKELVGMSTNLLGKFKIEWLIFEAINRPRIDYWEKNNGTINVDEIEFRDNNNLPVFIRMDFLHNKNCPAEKNKGKQNSSIVLLNIYVVHKPQKSNYWHFEIKITDENDLQIDRDKIPDWQKKGIASFLEIHFIHAVSAYLPDFDIVDETFYTDKDKCWLFSKWFSLR